jgi:hypothetical protein
MHLSKLLWISSILWCMHHEFCHTPNAQVSWNVIGFNAVSHWVSWNVHPAVMIYIMYHQSRSCEALTIPIIWAEDWQEGCLSYYKSSVSILICELLLVDAVNTHLCLLAEHWHPLKLSICHRQVEYYTFLTYWWVEIMAGMLWQASWRRRVMFTVLEWFFWSFLLVGNLWILQCHVDNKVL